MTNSCEEQIKSIKTKVESLFQYMDVVGNGTCNLQSIHNDMTWLIKQAEHTERLSKKEIELNEFLQSHSKPKHLGRNVVDVAMDMIKEQDERNKTLENSIKKAIEMQEYYLVTNGDLQDENKHLREALEHIELNSDDKVAVFIANRTLEVFECNN